MGYWIGVPYWGRGYCTEAAGALLAHAFGPLGLHRVHATHLTRNPASGRVMQKLGMRHEGRMREHFLKWGVFEDVERYGILDREWPR
jgi:[ribosomal protein S5]-alanine N-acetyltransferase